ncbi:MAG: NAD(P)/FAD-dependent oxidoreductase [Flavobacteriales bacterium]|nr:NAD(P)/FAD-dependent oxidoreductase [Flavobacteriales bacterium]
MNIPESSVPRVVIVGGGFGGLRLAQKLDPRRFQVVLLDRHNYHAFQPLFYQVATAGLEPGSIAYPFRKIFSGRKNFFFRLCELKKILPEHKRISTTIGEVEYDYLVLATGATTNYFGLKNLEERTMPMKTVAEALDIRGLILQNFEKALLTIDLGERESLMSIVIIGAGPTGVELAGALAELRKDILPKDYPDLDVRAMDIHLIDSNGRVLKEMSEKSSAKALEVLKNMGVDVWFDTRALDFDGRKVICKDGRELSASTVIWAAGVKGFIADGLPAECIDGSRILVNTFNQVKGMENIFALGDVAKMVSEKLPQGHPMMAQPAMQQGVLLAANLNLLQAGRPMREFRYKNLGSMATIGRNKAVTELPHIKLYGWIAWVAWLFVHIYQLVGFRNKVVVLVSWMLNYIRHSRDLRLIIRPFNRK